MKNMESIKDIEETIFTKEELEDIKNMVKVKKNIMIIDDNCEIVDAVGFVLKNYYNLIPCLSFEDAKKKFNSSIDVVLLDIKMAGKNGIEIFKILKEMDKNIRIIFHSAYPGAEKNANIADSLPHDGYLTKGKYTLRDFFKTIQNAINKK
ncbi:MAG: response regulator [Spirochaetes bacterium]|nr:response regulator [Spirochaetota bacterium]